MARPRRDVVQLDRAAWYHCVSRCVRRGYWQGRSSVTGADCRHRKDWIEARLASLGKAFAIDLAAYAVMENHVHVVVRMDPLRTHGWSDEEAVRRWLSLFPMWRPEPELREPDPAKVAECAADREYVAKCRKNLGDLSWVMICLKEWMARRANREDQCTGRYWEGRYKCQRIADAGALFMTMVYVDLNPVRAGVVDRPEAARHTSLGKRLEQTKPKVDRSARLTFARLLPVEEIFPDGRMNTPLMTFNHYLKLVDLFGRRKRRGPRQKAIAPELRPILERLGIDERYIPDRMEGFRQCHDYLIGSPETLKRESEACGRPCRYRSAAGRRWFRPMVSAPT